MMALTARLTKGQYLLFVSVDYCWRVTWPIADKAQILEVIELWHPSSDMTQKSFKFWDA